MTPMTPISIRRLLGVFALVAGAGWGVLALAETRGAYMPIVPWAVDVVLVALIVVLAVWGLRVRAYLKGTRPRLDSRQAVRTLVLAQTSAYGGALLGGWYGAQVLVVLRDWGIEPRRERAIAALIAMSLALALALAGLIVERWCRIRGGLDTDGSGRSKGSTGTRGTGGGVTA